NWTHFSFSRCTACPSVSGTALRLMPQPTTTETAILNSNRAVGIRSSAVMRVVVDVPPTTGSVAPGVTVRTNSCGAAPSPGRGPSNSDCRKNRTARHSTLLSQSKCFRWLLVLRAILTAINPVTAMISVDLSSRFSIASSTGCWSKKKGAVCSMFSIVLLLRLFLILAGDFLFLNQLVEPFQFFIRNVAVVQQRVHRLKCRAAEEGFYDSRKRGARRGLSLHNGKVHILQPAFAIA